MHLSVLQFFQAIAMGQYCWEPPLEKGTGKNQAEAIKSIFYEGELNKQCVVMCFKALLNR